MGLLETDVIRRSVVDLENRRTEAQRSVMEATTALEALDRELSLLKELLRIREGGGLAARNGTTGFTDVLGPTSAPRIGTDASRVVDEVATILREAGQPLPIRVIYDQLKDRGIPLPGQGRMANVIGAIRRSSTIDRPTRGVYALADWPNRGGESPTVAPSRRTQRQKHRGHRVRVKA